MKIILITNCFYPISNGGTEKYIYLIAKHLKSTDLRILSVHQELKKDKFEDIDIDYILPNSNTDKSVIKGITAPNNLLYFKQYLEEQQPDIVNFHTLSSDFNHHHIQLSSSLGIKTFLTSHIPGHQCLRSDFIYHGKKPCDGKVEKNKCIKCLIFSSKASFLEKVSRYIYYSISQNDPATLIIKQIKSIQDSTHKIIAVCDWQKDFFKKNGIIDSHLAVCRQEISSKHISYKKNNSKLTFGFLGRTDPIKGLDLLLKTLKKIDSNKIQLKIGVIPATNAEQKKYCEELIQTSKDLDCQWNFNLNEKQIEDFFKEIDYLIVPSLWFETGPFVIYEALAYDTPVITTNLGGQRELIKNGENGYLFEPNEESLYLLLKKIINTSVLKIKEKKLYSEQNIALRTQKIYQE